MDKCTTKLDFNQILFQVYRLPITNTRPEKLITLNQFLDYTKNPPNRTIDILNQIAEASFLGNEKLKAYLKQKYLYYFTPCVVIVRIRNYDNILSWTGLLVLDFDKIDYAADFKSYLFQTYRYIIACWLSPSRRGVKAIVRVPVVYSVEEFKEYYWGIAAEMEQYNGFDSSGQNCVLPFFQSWDPELLDRPDAELWTTKGTKRNNFKPSPITPAPNINATDKDRQIILGIIDTGFMNITDYGHPPLRDLCLTIGGYIASGYIDEHEALQLINHKINNHYYLKKGIKGYQKTAQWAIREGQSSPLILNYQKHGRR